MRDMKGTLALAGAEIKRLRRNRRYLLFTIGLPVILYLIFAKQNATAYGVSFAAFYMVGIASFGAFSGAFNNNTIRISQERKEGWIRQLRLTPLPPNAYVVAKIIASMATSVPAIVIVLLLGRFDAGIHLPAWEWIVIAVTIWLGTLIFAALAVAIGYAFDPDSVQPIAFLVYFLFVIFGGLWFPLSGGLRKFGEITPTYWIVRIGTDVISKGTVSVTGVVVILAWLVGFVALATLVVRAKAEVL
jgi:ABC-2 type transport system permease protein